MRFRAYPPSPFLEPIVQCYLESDGQDDTVVGEHMLFPNGFSGIYFNFGKKGKINIRQEQQVPDVSVSGQIDTHFNVSHPPGFYSVGVLLKPTALSRILCIDAAELTNAAIDGTLLRKDFTALHQELHETWGIARKIKRIEQFLCLELSERDNNPSFIDLAVEALDGPDYWPIEKLARNLRVSERHLEVQFRRIVGLTPKTYSLITRFKRMECHLKKLPAIRWQDMSFAHEYHDQNHFIKDFKRFTGQTPSAYLLTDFEMASTYLRV